MNTLSLISTLNVLSQLPPVTNLIPSITKTGLQVIRTARDASGIKVTLTRYPSTGTVVATLVFRTKNK